MILLLIYETLSSSNSIRKKILGFVRMLREGIIIGSAFLRPPPSLSN